MQGHPPNFAQTHNPYSTEQPYGIPYDPYSHHNAYPISSPPHVEPSLTHSTTSTSSGFTPSALPFIPRSQPQTTILPFPPTTSTTSVTGRSVSVSPEVSKRNNLLDPSAKGFSINSESKEEFPSLSSSSSSNSPVKKNSSSSAPASRSNSVLNSSSKSNGVSSALSGGTKLGGGTKGGGKSETSSTKDDKEDGGSASSSAEVELTTLIDQLYAAASKIKQSHSTEQTKLNQCLTEKETLLKKEKKEREEDLKNFVMEQDRYLKEMEQWEKESKRLKELEEEVKVANAAVASNNAKGKEKEKEIGFLTKIHRGVQVDQEFFHSSSTLPFSIPKPPSRPITPSTSTNPPVASTSASTEPPQEEEDIELTRTKLEEYQLLLLNVQTKLSQVEQDKLTLDHRIAQMVQEKETLWPEQRQVLMQKAEGEKRELEKKLEKALKRVEVLEKDRPAPVLRIGSGPPKFLDSRPSQSAAAATVTPTGPDPRLAQLEARLAEVESDLTEATVRASTAEEALEEYQTRTDKLIGDQQTSIDSLTNQKEKLQDQVHLVEKQIASIKKKAKELNDSHQVTMAQRKAAEDEARNEMLRLKDQLKDLELELEKEKLKSTKDLAANERRKIEAKHQNARENDRMKFEKEVAALKAQLERERKAHEYEIEEAGLSHGEELGDLEYQLRDETEQHSREIESMNKKHEAEMNALRTQLDAVTQSFNILQAEKGTSSSSNGTSTPLSASILSGANTRAPGAGAPRATRPRNPISRATLADQDDEKRAEYAKLGEDLVNQSGLNVLD